MDLCVNQTILGYTTQLRQLFTNLIQNSIKFRRLDQDAIIKISCSSASKQEILKSKLKLGKQYLKIEFQDNGIGFEKEYSEKIFQVFQRLNGKAEYKGSGIGLSICRKIVDNHQGHIFAEGGINEGAKFTILLPE